MNKNFFLLLFCQLALIMFSSFQLIVTYYFYRLQQVEIPLTLKLINYILFRFLVEFIKERSKIFPTLGISLLISTLQLNFIQLKLAFLADKSRFKVNNFQPFCASLSKQKLRLDGKSFVSLLNKTLIIIFIDIISAFLSLLGFITPLVKIY